MPDVSYHGENAWQVKSEVYSRQLGVLYAGEDLGDTECFIAYNMHWLPHDFALPSPGKEKRWCLVADTEKGFVSAPVLLEDQKKIALPERSIVVLVSEKQPKKAKKPSPRTRARKTVTKIGEQEQQ